MAMGRVDRWLFVLLQFWQCPLIHPLGLDCVILDLDLDLDLGQDLKI